MMTLNTDGGARGNPGPSGIGIVLRNDSKEIIFELGKCIGIGTNNVAEYTALVTGIEKALEKGATSLSCFLDSELIVKQLNGLYKVKNKDLKVYWDKIKNLEKKFKEISYKHVYREDNKEADLLVNKALDGEI